jgi:putative spermidine/putrescine transport system ATP-binding protein
VAGFIGVSNLIERDGHTITVRPEKLTLIEADELEQPDTHTEPGQVRDVIYAGVLTRYVVDLDAGGELVVSRQNAEARTGIAAGSRVHVAWRPDQAFTIPHGPDLGSGSGGGNQ